MANYHYDEAGNMAAYFIITFLALVLTPLTVSISPSSRKHTPAGCQCQPCIDQRARVDKRENSTLLNPKFSKKTTFLIAGWSLFAYLAYKTANAKVENKIYDPFEVLGLRAGVNEKEIKSHFKKLSRMYHPDKVKITVNETIETIANRFVDITKAYKSLTDVTIRKNWEQYGHPDGRQEVSMGIALPQWIIEGKNNIWVLGIYGLIFGGALPALVGKWWFGSRQKTKDGINAKTAASFFQSLKEEATMDEVVGTLGRAYAWEGSQLTKQVQELVELEDQIKEQLGGKWRQLQRLADAVTSDQENKRNALILLYAHLLRIPISKPSLRKAQTNLLLQTPVLLNALLTISISRNWLTPTLGVMRLHSYLAQALLPGQEKLRFAQLPGIRGEELQDLPQNTEGVEEFVTLLENQGDQRVDDLKKAVATCGRLELVDASFKVIGERLVTPSSIVFLVLKLRISPPLTPVVPLDLDVNGTKRSIKQNEEKDNQFLTSRKDAEDLPDNETNGWAHAPFWPGYRKPGWWIVLADDKSNRIVVPPMKITDIPVSRPDIDRNYRSYKIQFQAPQTTGLFTWKIYLMSDTYVGEEVRHDIKLIIDDVSALNVDEHDAEDEISEPDEDTLAGQMAAMRGGTVKKRKDESDEESGTDDDQASDSSDSDSD